MFKYLPLLILTLLLSACTRQIVTPDDILPTLSGEQAQIVNMNTSMLLANMDIHEQLVLTGGTTVVDNPVYSGAYNLLSTTESRCVGRDFEAFRVCLIDGLTDIRDDFDTLTSQGEDIDTYIKTIERELSYIEYYRMLDNQEMPSEYYRGGLWDEESIVKSCYSIMTGSITYPRSPYDMGEDFIIYIDLGFQDTVYDELVGLFPSWSDAREIPLSQESYNCSWMTFGPGYGTILYAFERDNTVYLFIKDADGAGSGEFNYSIFAYSRDIQKFEHLGSFYAYGGILPFPLIRNDDNGEPISSGRITILGDYQNRTFLYGSYIYEPMYDITTTIQSLLDESIQ